MLTFQLLQESLATVISCSIGERSFFRVCGDGVRWQHWEDLNFVPSESWTRSNTQGLSPDADLQSPTGHDLLCVYVVRVDNSVASETNR